MYKAGIIIFHVSLIVYLVSLWHFLMYVLRGAERLAGRGFRLTFYGLVIHGVSIVVVALGQRSLPWANSLQNISFWCWVVVAICLAVSYRFRVNVLGLFVLPFVVVLLFMAMTGQKSSSIYSEHIGRSLLGAVHISFVFVAYASFAFAAVASFMYILQSHFLKKKETGELYVKLPPLDLLDRLNFRALLAGLIFLSAGLILGFYWLAVLPQKPEGFDPKIVGSLGIWVVYAVLLLMRATSVLRGKKVAWLSILGIVVIVLSFLFVPHLLPKQFTLASLGRSEETASATSHNGQTPPRNSPIDESVLKQGWTL